MATDEDKIRELAAREGLVLRTVEVLKVEPGDTILITTETKWSEDATARAHRLFGVMFPGANIVVLGQAKMAVVRPPEGTPTKDITLNCGCWLVTLGPVGTRTIPSFKACPEHDGAELGDVVALACQAGLLGPSS
jgi:hypothetical protein